MIEAKTSLTTYLELGRISNLPTVWTNTIAGVVLAGGTPADWRVVIVLLAMSMAYTGGMFLNDAFDQNIDTKERPERPIPSGKISASKVFIFGYLMLAASIILVGIVSLASNGGGYRAILAASALSAFIVLYNKWHKTNPLSPLIMGLCRMLVYITAGWSLSTEASWALYGGAVALLCYLIGLTYTAKQELTGEVKNLLPLTLLAVPAFYGTTIGPTDSYQLLAILFFLIWVFICLRLVRRRRSGDIPSAVVNMIAGICLVDAVLIASSDLRVWALLAIPAFLLTLYLQRFVKGT